MQSDFWDHFAYHDDHYGLSSGRQPIGGSVVCDEVAEVIGSDGDFIHGYTYPGHPVAAAVALKNLKILQDDYIVKHVRDVASL